MHQPGVEFCLYVGERSQGRGKKKEIVEREEPVPVNQKKKKGRLLYFVRCISERKVGTRLFIGARLVVIFKGVLDR